MVYSVESYFRRGDIFSADDEPLVYCRAGFFVDDIWVGDFYALPMGLLLALCTWSVS